LGVLKARRTVAEREVKLFDVMPDAVASTEKMDGGILAALKRKLGGFLERAKRITWRAIFGREEINAKRRGADNASSKGKPWAKAGSPAGRNVGKRSGP
jgi:hypothetical protein